MEALTEGKWLRRLILAALLAILTLLAFQVLQPFIVPVIWSAILAYVSWPLHARLVRVFRGQRDAAAFVMTLLLAIAIILPIVWLVILVQTEALPVYRDVAPLLARGGSGHGRRERRLRVGNGAAIVVVEREGKQLRRVGDMRRLPKARANNDAGHAGLIEYPLAGHGSNRDAVLRGHGVRGAQHALKRRPATGGANEPTILHLRPGAQRVPVGFGRAEPAFAEKSAQ